MSSISTILTSFNSEKTIKESIQSAIVQFSEDDELIVVDDGSQDSTLDIVKSFKDKRIKCYQNHCNRGISFSRNIALKKSTKEYICFLDSDDLWPSGRQDFLRQIISNKSPDYISGYLEHFFCPSLSLLERSKIRLPKTQAAEIAGVMIFSKKVLNRVGYFDESLFVGEFIDFLSRVKSENFFYVKTEMILSLRRIHRHNNSILMRKKIPSEYFSVIRAHLERNK